MPTKTDSEVEQWVLRELSLSTKIRSREICVLARDGVITLRGSAQSYQDKLAIEDATRRANGVVGVVNEMRVAPCSPPTEKVLTSVALTVSPGRDMFAQSAAIQSSAAKAATA